MDVLAIFVENAEFLNLLSMKPCVTPVFRLCEAPSDLHYHIHELGGRCNLLRAILHCAPLFDHLVCLRLRDSEGLKQVKLLNQRHHLPDRQIDDALDAIKRGLVVCEHLHQVLKVLGVGSNLSNEFAQLLVGKELFWRMCTK